jgi:pilus assembly protein CpaE
MLDLQADYTISDLCDTPEQLDASIINKAMVKHSTGIQLLARPNQFKQADQITAAHCASVLGALQQMYEYVVVDGPSRFDSSGSAVIDMCQASLVVVQLLVTSVRNAHRMFEDLRDGGYNLDRFHLICNRVGLESGHLEMEHVQHTLNRKIEHEIPDDWKTVSSAINVGVPLVEAAPRSRVRAAIREIAEQIAGSGQDRGADAASGKSGLLGRIFSGAAN